ncbi:MAG TPA: Asp-tRNA(Asn)/Glu-tRNA(Gln) amidotransferase subunit GatA [Puia sp.]|nr:Asp-tRNA(Asn)/Glu-tRNA(Gln) amidotransferase subunit GatA [Puia sp.]
MSRLFTFHSIQDYHKALQDGTASCEEAVLYYLRAIEQQQQLNAFTTVYGEEALAKARSLDERRKTGQPMGKLHGVVIGLKAVIAWKDYPLTAASNILRNYTSLYNATVVDKMLGEEAILIGHLNCDEFAMGSSNENSAFGNVLNARNKDRVPGGSSGGSAVAVQAGLCMLSLGSDTGGSVRQPADFCGILGLKPTYGRVSRYGLIAYASSFDQIGIFGGNVRDVALLLEVIAGEDDYDSTVKQEAAPSWTENPDRKYRIAYFKEALDHPGLDPEIRCAILERTRQWREAGHTVEAIDFELLDYIVPAYYVLTTAEASSNLARYDGVRYGHRSPDPQLELTEFYKRNRSEGFGREVKRRILLGTFVLSAGYYDAYFTKAQQVRQLVVERTNLIFKDFDIIILPTAPTTAWRIGEKTDDPISMYLADIYTVYANLTGIPGISLPLFGHTNGMPFGMQAMTSRFNELSLLQFSHQMMQQ